MSGENKGASVASVVRNVCEHVSTCKQDELMTTRPADQAASNREVFSRLQAGDRIELEHEVKVGLRSWTSKTAGTVVSTERRRHGLHMLRNPDDKVFSDLIVLQRDDGERTTITLDEFSVLKKL